MSYDVVTVPAPSPREVGCHAMWVGPTEDMSMAESIIATDRGPHDPYSGHPCEECGWKIEKLLAFGYEAVMLDMVEI